MREKSPRSLTNLRLRFAAGFVLVAGVLFTVYTLPTDQGGISESVFSAYLGWYARLTGHVLALFDPAVSVHGQDVVGRYSLRIVRNCDAMEANILFASAVLAFPGAWKKRLAGVVLGIPLLVAVNVLRICSLYYVGIHWPSAFEVFHLEVWPLILIACGVAAFLIWAVWAEQTSSVGAGDAAL
jgi:exosortase/archaeosortase family protein